jgi:hypothetical protein
VFPGRYFRQTLVPNGGERLGDNEVDWTIELVTATMQAGTHLDALCHLRRGDAGHDGWTLRRDTTPEGATRLGIESAPQFVTRQAGFHRHLEAGFRPGREEGSTPSCPARGSMTMSSRSERSG